MSTKLTRKEKIKLIYLAFCLLMTLCFLGYFIKKNFFTQAEITREMIVDKVLQTDSHKVFMRAFPEAKEIKPQEKSKQVVYSQVINKNKRPLARYSYVAKLIYKKNRKILVVDVFKELFDTKRKQFSTKEREVEWKEIISFIKKPKVKVAALQFYSRIGQRNFNRKKLTELILEATKNGAKIILMPECSAQGYKDVKTKSLWKINPQKNHYSITKAAETIPGPSTIYFSRIAIKLKIHIALSLIEEELGKFYNTLVMFDPEGEIIAHHRKKYTWMPGDFYWMTEGTLPIQTVVTKYGKIALMTCYDFTQSPKPLDGKEVNIALFAGSNHGLNIQEWSEKIKKNNPSYVSVVAAWPTSFASQNTFSCVIGKDGKILNKATKQSQSEIIYAEIEIPY